MCFHNLLPHRDALGGAITDRGQDRSEWAHPASSQIGLAPVQLGFQIGGNRSRCVGQAVHSAIILGAPNGSRTDGATPQPGSGIETKALNEVRRPSYSASVSPSTNRLAGIDAFELLVGRLGSVAQVEPVGAASDQQGTLVARQRCSHGRRASGRDRFVAEGATGGDGCPGMQVLSFHSVFLQRSHALRPLARFAVATIVLVVASCAPARDASTPEARAALFDEFRRGDTTLTCTIPCISAWLRSREQMRAYDAAGDWQSLATLVASTGYTQDVGYYYLGRAADGLDLPEAANRYYRQSYALTTGPITAAKCRSSAEDCNGVDLLAVLPARLANGRGTPVAVADSRPQRSSGTLPRGGTSDPFQYCQAVGDDDAPSRARGYTGSEDPSALGDPNAGGYYLWRCMDRKVMVCTYGANPKSCQPNPYGLNPSPAVRRACREHPNEPVTRVEHDGSLFWNCRGTTPVLSMPQSVDRRGYATESWTAARR